MGQLFRRIARIAKSYFADSDYSATATTEDDELKRIIDELNNKKDKSERKSDSNRHSANKANPNAKEQALRVLGLPLNATVEDIKSAYRAKMKEHHPDKVANMPESVRRSSQDKASEINAAYQLLKEIMAF